jgi:sugar O-acyltransferase (sialic acid O-acetyltransferase NeuD family)
VRSRRRQKGLLLHKMLWLYGEGGHARVIRSIAGGRVSSVTDKDYNEDVGAQVVDEWIVAVGDNRARHRIACMLGRRSDIKFARIASSKAVLCEGLACLGDGTVVMSGTVIEVSTTIGRHCIVNTGAVVNHDCILADFVHVGPGVVLCGQVRVGEGAFVGAGSVVLPGIRIGDWATVGAGSVVTHEVPARTVAYGNPCRVAPNP